MAQFAPQFSLYVIIGRLKVFGSLLFWAIFALSFYPFLADILAELKQFSGISSAVNIVFISVFFILEIVVDFILLPIAERRRRDDFIDNSFGSRFGTNNSIGYFDNDNVGLGKYKAAVNLFQNCFFSYSLLKAVTPLRVIIPGIVFIAVAVLACFGFNEVPFALSVLQVLFSTSVLGSLVKHFVLLTQISNIHENWIQLFQRPDFTSTNSSYDNQILRNWVHYESLISRMPPDMSDRIFNKHNAKLTTEWSLIKARYHIT